MYSSVNDMAKFMMNLFHETDNSVFQRSTVKESLTPQWNDFSGTGGFGLPYEMYFFDNLWVMTKGGSLPGHYSETFYVKELKLGVSIATSPGFGIIPPLNVAFSALSIMAGAVKSVLAAQQSALIYPAPPNIVPDLVGCFTGPVLDTSITFTITVISTGELQIQGITIYYRNLSPDGYLFQAGMQTGVCSDDEVGAMEGQYILFQPTGNTYSLIFPTLVGLGDQFVKTQCLDT